MRFPRQVDSQANLALVRTLWAKFVRSRKTANFGPTWWIRLAFRFARFVVRKTKRKTKCEWKNRARRKRNQNESSWLFSVGLGGDCAGVPVRLTAAAFAGAGDKSLRLGIMKQAGRQPI